MQPYSGYVAMFGETTMDIDQAVIDDLTVTTSLTLTGAAVTDFPMDGITLGQNFITDDYEIIDGGVSEAKLGTNSVSSAKLQTNSVTDAKIDSMDAAKLTGTVVVPVDNSSVTTDALTLAGGVLEPTLTNLTAAEVSQLVNINLSTISETQWGYVAGLDQGLSVASSPSFAGLSLVNGIYSVGFTAPALSASTSYVLPAADGTAGYVLGTDGAGNLSWIDNPAFTSQDQYYFSSSPTSGIAYNSSTVWSLVSAGVSRVLISSSSFQIEGSNKFTSRAVTDATASSGGSSANTMEGGLQVAKSIFCKDLSVDNTLVVGVGSAAAPSYTFTGDTDTGIFRSAADTIGVSTGGTERLSISDAITSTIPIKIEDSKSANPLLSVQNAAETNATRGLFRVFDTSTLGSTAGNQLDISQEGGRSSNLLIKNTALYRETAGSDWTTAVYVDYISIDNAYSTIASDARCFIKRDPLNQQFYFGSSANTYCVINPGSTIAAQATEATDRFTGALRSYGGLGVVGNVYSTRARVGAGTAAAPSLSFDGDDNTGLYSVAADTLGISTAGVLRFVITPGASQFTLPFYCSATTEATSKTTGVIKTDGGISAQKNIHGGQQLTLDAQPFASYYASAYQSIPQLTWTKVTMTTQTALVGITIAADVFTINSAGRYCICANTLWRPVGGGGNMQVYTSIYVNGASAATTSSYINTLGTNDQNFSKTINLAATDTVAMYVYHIGGANRDMSLPDFSIVKLH